jgi:hypothetical protein
VNYQELTDSAFSCGRKRLTMRSFNFNLTIHEALYIFLPVPSP